AALAEPRVKLSLVTGPRADHVRVRSGTESLRWLDARALRARWRLDEAARAWKRFAYGEAARLLEDPEACADRNVQRARRLSRGYAAWDAFDHAAAYHTLQTVGKYVPGDLLRALYALQRDPPDRRGEGMRIWDLCLMAERRERAGRLDAAALLL